MQRLRPLNDFIFKKLFGETENIDNLKSFLNAVLNKDKTQELVEKPITSITFFKDFAKSKDFYKYFKELLNNELEGDEINFNLPSSHTSSSFK